MAQQRRTIHPGDVQDERLAQVPLTAAYTYVYLPTVLDDAGRAKDQPAVLNGHLWPLRADEHSTEAMAADLDALSAAGLICRYTVDESAYLHDPAWRPRQRIARPEPSILPPCPTHETAMDDLVGDTLRKLSEQISSFVGSAAASFNETKFRDAVSHAVEDVTFMIDPEKAASFGQKVREFLGESTVSPRKPERDEDPYFSDGDVWHEVTDRPDGRE
ncbi:MAG TPA: hypothetical protein VFR23_13230 [Jiangellaceae bacterium]|nr:hypothetical protein [Jiangellaceae bacterium]